MSPSVRCRGVALQVVLLSEAYLTALLPSHKKRVCQYCLHTHSKRLTAYCRDCNQCWYCSHACQDAHQAGLSCHVADPAVPVKAHTAHLVPHRLTCPVLKRFSSIKCDPAMESVVRMLLDAMALQLESSTGSAAGNMAAEEPGMQSESPSHRQETAESSQNGFLEDSLAAKHPQLPHISHQHLTQLQSHAADFTDKDRKDWLVNLRFLRNAMQQVGWPGIWSEEALLDMVGRIASNNFGIYHAKQRQQAGPAGKAQLDFRQQQSRNSVQQPQQHQQLGQPQQQQQSSPAYQPQQAGQQQQSIDASPSHQPPAILAYKQANGHCQLPQQQHTHLQQQPHKQQGALSQQQFHAQQQSQSQQQSQIQQEACAGLLGSAASRNSSCTAQTDALPTSKHLLLWPLQGACTQATEQNQMPAAHATQQTASPQASVSQGPAEEPSASEGRRKHAVSERNFSEAVQAAMPIATGAQETQSEAALRLAPVVTPDVPSSDQAKPAQRLPASVTLMFSSQDDQADAQVLTGAAEQSTADHAESTQHSIQAERDAPTNSQGAQRFSQATDELNSACDQTKSGVAAEKSNSTGAEPNQQCSAGIIKSLSGVNSSDLVPTSDLVAQVDSPDLVPQVDSSDLAQAIDQKATVSGKEEVIGREMYITASFFNHSCEPNCVKTRKHGSAQGIAAVTALRDVEAGEALTISYIDLELPRSARQLELKTSFFFDCKCARCERELTEGSKKCSYSHKQTQRKCQAPKRRGIKARVSR